MSIEVLPVINCLDEGCVLGMLERAATFLPEGSWIHLDVADGRFTVHKTWNDPSAWAAWRKPYKLEVHLMVEEPERAVPEWLAAGAKRLIVHYEALADTKFRKVPISPESLANRILEAADARKVPVLLGINPETPVEPIADLIGRFAGAELLAVTPGLAGQKFLPVVLDKIAFLRRRLPNAKLEVDGGMNKETTGRAKAAGADIVSSASYIFGSPDPGATYADLCRV